VNVQIYHSREGEIYILGQVSANKKYTSIGLTD
jgi:hypothetical protein